MSQTPAARSCQPCTACCDGWLQISVNGAPVHPGKPCPYSTGSGCSNYANRPVDPCVHFVCGWRSEGSPLPDWMKPSSAKVIVLYDQTRWRGMPVDVAVPVGRRIPPRSLKWLMQYAEMYQRGLLYSEQVVDDKGNYNNQQRFAAFGPSEFQQEMAALAAQGKRPW